MVMHKISKIRTTKRTHRSDPRLSPEGEALGCFWHSRGNN